MNGSTTRRQFVKIMGVSAAAPAILYGCAAGVAPTAFGTVAAGNISALPVGTLRFIAGHPVIIGRDSGGVYSMTSTCTHAGCDMSTRGSIDPAGVVCNCHNSNFDANGNAIAGPASGVLAHFSVTIDAAGALTVHGDSEVATSTRLAV